MDRDDLLVYPYFNEKFKIHIDTSNIQLGAVIIHNGKSIAVYSRKINVSQMRYKLTDKELLKISETLKQFKTILLGQRLKIYTDNKNLHVNILIIIEYSDRDLYMNILIRI